jgi:hypothetical protein
VLDREQMEKTNRRKGTGEASERQEAYNRYIIVAHRWTARAWFYGKLLLAAICEAVVNSGRFSLRRAKCPRKNGTFGRSLK